MKDTLKIINDRLNHLKSELATLKAPKMDKRHLNEDRLLDLETRIDELQKLKKKING